MLICIDTADGYVEIMHFSESVPESSVVSSDSVEICQHYVTALWPVEL